MKKLSQRLMALTAILQIVLGWSGWAILKSVYPDMSLFWYPYIPLLFTLLGMGLIIVLKKNCKKDGKKLVTLYMLMKLLKLVTSIGFFLTFYFIARENIRIFGLVFALNYAIYIGLETFIFYSIEKLIKKESK